MKLGVSPSFDTLPPEILLEITSYLSAAEWACLKYVSSHFYFFLNAPLFQDPWNVFLNRLQALSPFPLEDPAIPLKKEILFTQAFNFINRL